MGEVKTLDAARLMLEPGSVAELRILNTNKKTVSGYFDDFDKLAAAAAEWDGKAPGVYVTLNAVNPDLLARSSNHLTEWARFTTSDTDILRRRWLPIDCDPVRASGISSTEEEHDAAIARAREIGRWLGKQGWQRPVWADSGNGGHLLYRIDLPNDSESTDLIRRCLEALDLRFSDGAVTVDVANYNPARIWKVYGTTAAKGDSTQERPHRVSKVLSAPPKPKLVDVALLMKLADAAPQRPTLARGGEEFDVEAFMAANNLFVKRTAAWQGGTKWVLETCPWNPEHTDDSAVILRFPGGALSAKCHHNGCTGNDWAALRSLYEPDYEQRREQRRDGASPATEEPPPVKKVEDWPEPAAEEAFYGLAGDIVRTLEPHTEADPHALLADILTTFGMLVGLGPYFSVGLQRHELRVWPVIVGPTGHGRKGLSHAEIMGVYVQAVEDFRKRLTTGLSTGEGLIAAVHDPIYRHEAIKESGRVTGYQEIEVDAGVEDKRLLVVESEFGRTLRALRREGNTLSPVMRQAWDHGDLKTMTKTKVEATGAHVAIVAHITKEELLRQLDTTEAGSGFANRFFWIASRRSQLLPAGGRLPPDELNEIARKLREALAFAATVGEMRRDAAATDIWNAGYGELSQGKPGLFGAIVARSEAYVMRLACVYALLDKSGTVKAEHLMAALALWEYAERTVRYIFGDATGDATADTILRALRVQGPMTQTGIYDGLFASNRSAERIAQALSLLAEAGLATAQTVEPTGKAGRPMTIWSAR